MSCDCPKENISAYLDGALSPEESTLADEHLQSCGECALYFEELRDTIKAAWSVEDVEPPSWLTQKVMAKVREETESKKGILQKLFFPLHIKLPLEAFATIAVAVTALFVFKAVQPELDRAKTSVMHPQEIEIMEDATVDRAPASSEIELMMEKRQMQLRESEDADTYQFAPMSPARDMLDSVATEEQKIMPPALKKRDAAPFADFYRADKEEPAGASNPLQFKSAPAKKQDDAILTFSINIYKKDIGTARSEIEEIVKELDAEIVRIESIERKEVFFVRIDAGRLIEFQKNLIPVGSRLTEGSIDTGDLLGDVQVKIEVLMSYE